MKYLLLYLVVTFLTSCASGQQPANSDTTGEREFIEGTFNENYFWATFKGGKSGLLKYLRDHINFSVPGDSDYRENESVHIMARVDTLGKLSAIECVEEVVPENKQFVKEALRVVHEMPDWDPSYLLEDGKKTLYSDRVHIHVHFKKAYYDVQIKKQDSLAASKMDKLK